MANNSNSTQSNTVQEGQQIKSTVGRSNLFNEFFWICSGANRHILRQCPTEYSKYFGIGGTIFFTAAMAALSGGYAISMVFSDLDKPVFWIFNQSSLIGIIFGIFWGLLIFNLDRFMVNTMYSDGTSKITKEELNSGIPRLILAIFIGIVISAPIELRIFKDKIDDKLVQTNRDYAEATYGNQIKNCNENIEKLTDENSTLTSQNRELQAEISKAYQDYDDERTGKGGSGRIGYGANAIRREDNYKNIKATNEPIIEENNDLIGSNRNAIKLYRAERDSLQHLYDNIVKGEKISHDTQNHSNGFTNRLSAFDEVTVPWKDGNVMLFIARILIMLLFVTIEIIPTLFKMMMTSGPYDEMLNEEKNKKKVIAIQNVSNLNAEINTQIQIKVEKEQQRLQAELAANKQLLEKIASVQAELLETAVEEWRKTELEKIHADPSKYIQSNTTTKA